VPLKVYDGTIGVMKSTARKAKLEGALDAMA
jgi:hypothetical protein